ncbi:MAG: dihydroorotate dehydrogenase-like protein [Spirochaetes bacterium]|nr:dihydroorotate dehydrogenase-like protein [Spirochaetota bacterium]
MDLSVTYMGLKIANPIIVGSSGLTSTVDGIKHLEESGAAAVVLKSLFEEEILFEISRASGEGAVVNNYGEAAEYIRYYVREENVSNYLKLIENAKKTVAIPVIASINCVSAGEWVNFAKSIESAGADALELNIFIMPSDPRITSEAIERRYFDIIAGIRTHVKIPLALKIGYHFSGMAYFLTSLSSSGIQGLVLFNRFVSPDVDLKTLSLTAMPVYSASIELAHSLRWIGILAGRVKCDLAASTGVHDGLSLAKVLLVGASCAQIATAIYKNGAKYIEVMLDDLRTWMASHSFRSISDFRGKVSFKNIEDPIHYEQAQFMKYFSHHGKWMA